MLKYGGTYICHLKIVGAFFLAWTDSTIQIVFLVSLNIWAWVSPTLNIWAPVPRPGLLKSWTKRCGGMSLTTWIQFTLKRIESYSYSVWKCIRVQHLHSVKIVCSNLCAKKNRELKNPRVLSTCLELRSRANTFEVPGTTKENVNDFEYSFKLLPQYEALENAIVKLNSDWNVGEAHRRRWIALQ